VVPSEGEKGWLQRKLGTVGRATAVRESQTKVDPRVCDKSLSRDATNPRKGHSCAGQTDAI